MGTPCPVCRTQLRKQPEDRGDRIFCDCPCCGPFSLSGSIAAFIDRRLDEIKNGRARLSYALYRMTKQEQWAIVTTDSFSHIINNTELPRPAEQLENFILWLGDSLPNQGATVQVGSATMAAVGTSDLSGLGLIALHAIERHLISGEVRAVGFGFDFGSIRLTFEGWELYEELQRGRSSSRTAFMAMQFNIAELDRVYAECFKPAVAAAGFTLKRLDDEQPAGLIDDRLRVEIRQSRLLIADLSTANKGAYWEAGYAEGLGKPVIYTCRKDAFEDKATAPHFDTNHHLTVVWDPDKLADAAERLKATIRATLPEDAKLSD